MFNTAEGDVKATIDNAVSSRRSIQIRDGKASIIIAEHTLATFYAYGVDNAYIEVRRIPANKNSNKAQRLAYKTHSFFKRLGLRPPEVMPSLDDQQLSLCNMLDSPEYCPIAQDEERRVIRLSESFGNEKLSFHPIEGNQLVMHATTVYSPIGEQSRECVIDRHTFKNELAGARYYVDHNVIPSKMLPKKWVAEIASVLAKIAYPSFGFGHGFTRTNVFFPKKTKEEWVEQERYPAEIARHTIVDRLGAISLLGARLEGIRCVMKFSGHKNDVIVLKELAAYLAHQSQIRN